MTRRATATLRTGFREIPHRDTGLHKLHTRLSEGSCYSRRVWPHLALRSWDADVQEDAEIVAQKGAELHVEIAYSYGAGEGLTRFAPTLAEVAPEKPIDLAILIDPVRRYPVRKWRALMHGGHFTVPANVARVAVIRTVNKDKWDRPVGHDVVLANPETRIVGYTVFGSLDALREHSPKHPRPGDSLCPVEVITDPGVHHGNIDGLDEVHGRVINLLDALMKGQL